MSFTRDPDGRFGAVGALIAAIVLIGAGIYALILHEFTPDIVFGVGFLLTGLVALCAFFYKGFE